MIISKVEEVNNFLALKELLGNVSIFLNKFNRLPIKPQTKQNLHVTIILTLVLMSLTLEYKWGT